MSTEAVKTVSMSVQDALWLTMDRPNNLMVVDGAMVLRGQPSLEAVQNVFAEAVKRFPVLARKPVKAGMGWAWQDDPHFDPATNVENLILDEPMDMRGLQDFLAKIRAEPLDKGRPLWRGYLLSPVVLADGSTGSAIVSRFHHSIADGVRLTQVLLGLCESEELAVGARVARKGTKRTDESAGGDGAANVAINAAEGATSLVGHGLSGLVSETAHAARHPLHALADVPRRSVAAARAGMHVVEGGIDRIRHPDRVLDALEVLGVENHRSTNDLSSVTKLTLTGSEPTVWTGHPGTVKAVAWSAPIPLDSIKSVGKAAGATVNDVLLAAVAGGLRQYLNERDAAIDEVVWMVPVNLKPFEDNLPPDLGNYFALVFLPMPLSLGDARDRLTQMHHRMQRIKNSDEAVLTFGLQRIVSMSPKQIAFFLTNFFANKAIGVLTNVPGPSGPMTFAGVTVEQVVGFAPCSGDQPMTATIFSYNGGVTVGFASDAGLVSAPEELVDYVISDLAAMGVATG